MRINLLPKEERPLKQSTVRPGFIVGIAVLLLFGVVGFMTMREHERVGQLYAAYDRALANEAGLQRQVQGVSRLRQELAELEVREKAYQELLTEDYVAAALLPTLVERAFPGLWVEALVWDEAQVEISGYTKDMTSVSRYLNYLNERSDQASLSFVQPIESTNFILFGITVEGVRDLGQSQID